MVARQLEILWAEDNSQDRMLIHESLQGLPLPPSVSVVNDGAALLQALGAESPKLVVLDLEMPRLGGIDALRRIRTTDAWKELPVVIFSSGNRPDEVAECLALGARDVVQKPVDFDLFVAAVQRVVQWATLAPSPTSTAS